MKGLVVILLILAAGVTIAQEALPINIETALKLGGADNLTIREHRQQMELAVADLAKAREWWLPELYAGIQTHQLWGAAMNTDGRFGLDLNRDNLWMGLGLDLTWDFADGIYQTKASKYQLEAARHENQADRNQALLEIIDVYYLFASAQWSFQAYQELVAVADTITQQLKIQVDAGLRYHSEWLLANSNLRHMQVQMLNAKAVLGKSRAALMRLLHLSPDVILVSLDSVITPLQLLDPDTETTASIMEDSVWTRRPEYLSRQFILKAFEVRKKTVNEGLLIPELRLSTYGSYFGALKGQVTPLQIEQHPETQQLYSTAALNIGLMWQVPLGRLTYGGSVKQHDAKIQLQKTSLLQVKAEINEEVAAAREDVSTLRDQVGIAQEGSQFAAEALSQSIERQGLGTV
ncbi:MAG: TolC family protein, partial [Saprospiraceae bacterium]|nr:TolC family protein [Saprospiraceae bacterium]